MREDAGHVRALSMNEIAWLTTLASPAGHAFRLNVVGSDVTSDDSSRSYRSSIHWRALNQQDVPADELPARLARDHGIAWVYVDGHGYVLPESLRALYPREHRFARFSVFTR